MDFYLCVITVKIQGWFDRSFVDNPASLNMMNYVMNMPFFSVSLEGEGRRRCQWMLKHFRHKWNCEETNRKMLWIVNENEREKCRHTYRMTDFCSVFLNLHLSFISLDFAKHHLILLDKYSPQLPWFNLNLTVARLHSLL